MPDQVTLDFILGALVVLLVLLLNIHAQEVWGKGEIRTPSHDCEKQRCPIR